MNRNSTQMIARTASPAVQARRLAAVLLLLITCSCTSKPAPTTTPLKSAQPQLYDPSFASRRAVPAQPGNATNRPATPASRPAGSVGSTRPSGSKGLWPDDAITGGSRPGGAGAGAGRGDVAGPGSGKANSPRASNSHTAVSTPAGIGHIDPLGQRTGIITGAQQQLEIKGKPTTAPGVGKPEPDKKAPIKKDEATTMPSEPERTSVAPIEFAPVDVNTLDVERLPPDRRAAVLRYLKTVQKAQATTAPAQQEKP